MRSVLFAIIPSVCMLVTPSRVVQAATQTEAIFVDASELDRRQDLVGKLVKTDDRVRFYQAHGAQGYDEVYLKRTHVIFRLPPRLRPENSPRPMPVVVEGKLGREEGELICEVTSLKVMPNDVDRLDQAVAALPAKDFENRKAWGVWAENRGKSFKPEDKVLIQRGKAIQAEALRIEAERKQVTVDAPAQWLALAEQAQRRNIPEPDPSALAHKAFQAKIAAAKGREIDDVIAAINRFFPQAAKDLASGTIPLGRAGRGLQERSRRRLSRGAGTDCARRSTGASMPTRSSGCWKPKRPRTRPVAWLWRSRPRLSCPSGPAWQPSFSLRGWTRSAAMSVHCT